MWARPRLPCPPRGTPAPGDVVILLGGRTGRDGCGGATGSSKAHKLTSLETCGAEVQKGNAPIERKLQRLFRREDACRMIKRCNDFGAGGVSVAIGELADGLYIDLNKVTKKYEGLDGTELAIRSQERMAVAVAAEDAEKFIAFANEENLEAPRGCYRHRGKAPDMVWNGVTIVNISREFLNSNGAEKHQNVHVEKGTVWQPQWDRPTFSQKMKNHGGRPERLQQEGPVRAVRLHHRRATVLMPFGGAYQLTPHKAMAAKLPVDGETTTCSGMAWGFNPYLMERTSTGRLHGRGGERDQAGCRRLPPQGTYLTFQEYFEHLNKPRALGQAAGRPAGCAGCTDGSGHCVHRRQGLHVRHL